MEYKLDFKTYNEALTKNRLLGLKCNTCKTYTCPPKMTCQECGGTDLEAVQMKGAGRITTFTQTFVAPVGREAEAPYVVVLVELDEGPWIAGNLIDIAPDKVGMDLIGKRVRLGHKVFPGDSYSAGPAARPLFYFE